MSRRAWGRGIAGLVVAAWATPVLAAQSQGPVLGWINDARRAHGLTSLLGDRSLSAAASEHSRAMAERGTLFYHADAKSLREGCDRLTQFEARADTLAGAYRAAMESAEHQRQVFGDYDHAGVGQARDASAVYVTWFFLRSATS
ncbi:MAG: hypothetical protein K0V04_36760 [Deltaproteobacteria bacterium]|nr:hypothetical protein [Deltaproteobacteria bacterium]